jgi:hypothetical protein
MDRKIETPEEFGAPRTTLARSMRLAHSSTSALAPSRTSADLSINQLEATTGAVTTTLDA